MQDWERYQGHTSYEGDPWELSPEQRRRRNASSPESHDPTPGHVIGSCGGDFSPPRPKRHTGMLVITLIVVICAAIGGISFALFGSVGKSVQTSGGDSFSVDVDPDGADESQQAEVESTSTVPSDIERYEGDSDFSLTLGSAQDLPQLTYQEIYAQVSPSVVTITVYGDSSGAYATGIILSQDGFILTNQHVVGGQSFAQVTTVDNMTYGATLVGEDPNSDLAVLKIEAQGLTPAVFGSSDELLVGDECFAIGNPLGITYRSSFTNGIVSALNRNVNMNEYTMSLIQTTAALNSGNSGGPLINIYGQVIGVNNMKIMSSSTTVEGLGFAIPSATAQSVTNALISTGEVRHPVMGITCYAVTAGGQEGYEVSGVLVVTVNSASDAAEQGLLPDDIITAVNGISCATVDDITLALEGYTVGDPVSLTVWRAGTGEVELTLQLMEQNDLA